MTTARAISALALLTASSSALAGAPLGLVALEEATNELVVLPAGEALTMDQTPVAAIFLDEDGLHEVRASPDHMVVDSLFEDPDAWEFEFVAVAGGPPGFIRTAYKPLGFILAIEGGGVEVFVHHPDNPLRVHFTDGWTSPMSYTQSDDSTIVTTGSENLVGVLVPNSVGGHDVVLRHYDAPTLTLAVAATMIWGDS